MPNLSSDPKRELHESRSRMPFRPHQPSMFPLVHVILMPTFSRHFIGARSILKGLLTLLRLASTTIAGCLRPLALREQLLSTQLYTGWTYR